MKKVYITDSQFDFLEQISISQNVRVSSLVQIAVNMALLPLVVNHLDIPLIDKPCKLKTNYE